MVGAADLAPSMGTGIVNIPKAPAIPVTGIPTAVKNVIAPTPTTANQDTVNQIINTTNKTSKVRIIINTPKK